MFDQSLMLPYTGIMISLVGYLFGMWLFKISNGFFLFTPLLVAMVFGIVVLALWAKGIDSTTAAVYTKYYLPGGNIIFWFINPATVAFAIPLYRRRDIFKKYWLDIVLTLVVSGFVSLVIIQLVAETFGLSRVSTVAMLPQAATTAVAMPIAKEMGGDPAVTAMACILNAVIIYALANFLLRIFRLKKLSKVGTGLGLGASGHTIGSAKALQLGSIEGAMASVAIVIVSLVMDVLVPIYVHVFMK